MCYNAKGVGRMWGDTGTLPECEMTPGHIALGRVELELVGLPGKAITQDAIMSPVRWPCNRLVALRGDPRMLLLQSPDPLLPHVIVIYLLLLSLTLHHCHVFYYRRMSS